MKTSILLMTGLVALGLGACSATTGSVAKSMAGQAAMQAAASKSAQPATAAAVEAPAVDTSMDCAALTEEMTEVDAIIAASNKTINGAGTADIAGKAAAAGASQAALHTGAAGALARVPFGGLFAKSAMDSVANSGQKKVAKAQSELQSANLRKATLTGLYAGKNCAS